MNLLKKQLYHISSIYYIALQVATLVKQNKLDEVRGIVWTVNRILNQDPSFENDVLETLLEIRKETMMDDGWVDYNNNEL
jgi:hypothetical protein